MGISHKSLLLFSPNFSFPWLPVSLAIINLILFIQKESTVAVFPIGQASRIWTEPESLWRQVDASCPGCKELLSASPHLLVSMAFPPACFYTFGRNSVPIPPLITFVTLGKRAKGNPQLHKSGLEYLLFVMNPTLMSLITVVLAIYHMSLVHQGNRS